MCTEHCSEYCAGEEVRTTVVTLPPTYDAKQLCESSTAAAASSEYMNKIRKRLNEDASARVEREKRRRKVLVEQLTAHQALEVGCFSSYFVSLEFFCQRTTGRCGAGVYQWRGQALKSGWAQVVWATVVPQRGPGEEL